MFIIPLILANCPEHPSPYFFPHFPEYIKFNLDNSPKTNTMINSSNHSKSPIRHNSPLFLELFPISAPSSIKFDPA